MDFKKDETGNIPVKGNKYDYTGAQEVEFTEVDDEMESAEGLLGESEKIVNEKPEFEDIYSYSSEKKKIEDNEYDKKGEKDSQGENPHHEKRTKSVEEKLLELQAKLAKNPPKTAIGRKIALAKINMLKAMIKRQEIRNEFKNLSEKKSQERAETLAREYESLDNDIRILKQQISEKTRQIREIEGTEEDRQDNERFIKIMNQRGTIQKTNLAQRVKDDNSIVRNLRDEKTKLEEKLEEKRNSRKNMLDQYENQEKNVKKELIKNELALLNPNRVFKRIGNFFQSKIQQFKTWRDARREKLDKKFKAELVDNTDSIKESAVEEAQKIATRVQERSSIRDQVKVVGEKFSLKNQNKFAKKCAENQGKDDQNLSKDKEMYDD